MKNYKYLSFKAYEYVDAKITMAVLKVLDIKTFHMKVNDENEIDFTVDLMELNQWQITKLKNYICSHDVGNIIFS